MKNNEIAVSIKNLNKIYKVYDSPGQRFLSLLLRRNLGRDFVALDDINVDIARGEAFAIVGKNGSGKSTMLQLLAGILKPTEGEIKVNGRIAALLELGSGFNPESTGYENIYMNAAILGLKKDEIERKVKDIIEFADIGQHLYEPVKTYSSGMYVRLGFAVAINVDADVLLVDEALAVGDVFFRQKCYSRLNELKEKGTTVILVTHNMSEVEQFCDRAMLLQSGKQISVGRSQEIVKEYYMEDQDTSFIQGKNVETDELNSSIKFSSGWEIKKATFYDLNLSKEISNGKASFSKIGLFDDMGNSKRVFLQGEYGYFYIEFDVCRDIEIPVVGILLFNQMNTIIHGKDSSQTYTKLPERVSAGTKMRFLQKVKFDIAEGEYSFEVGLAQMTKDGYAQRSYLPQESLDEKMERISLRSNVGTFAIVPKKIGEPTRMGFHGVCDLQGEIEILEKERYNYDSKKSR